MNSDSLNMVSRLGEGHMPCTFFFLSTTAQNHCEEELCKYVSINMNYLSLKLDYSPNVCVKSVRPRMVTTNFFLVGCITLHDTSFSICFKEKSVF